MDIGRERKDIRREPLPFMERKGRRKMTPRGRRRKRKRGKGKATQREGEDMRREEERACARYGEEGEGKAARKTQREKRY